MILADDMPDAYYKRGVVIRGGPYDGTFLDVDVRQETIKLADPIAPMPWPNSAGEATDIKAKYRNYKRVHLQEGNSAWFEYELLEK